MTDPLELVAEEITEESILLCVDEFMVCINWLALCWNAGFQDQRSQYSWKTIILQAFEI
jgi:hypothetical protein